MALPLKKSVKRFPRRGQNRILATILPINFDEKLLNLKRFRIFWTCLGIILSLFATMNDFFVESIKYSALKKRCFKHLF